MTVTQPPQRTAWACSPHKVALVIGGTHGIGAAIGQPVTGSA